MKQKILIVFFSTLFLACGGLNKLSQSGLTTKKQIEFRFSAYPAPEWTSLMERDNGWFGADGIFSIPLDGNESQGKSDSQTLFIFSDTYIGQVKNGVPLPGNTMVNNSTAWLEGNQAREDKISFNYNIDPKGNPIAYFTPDQVNVSKGEYFWLGDGFVNKELDAALYIFAYHVHKTGPNVFDFEQTEISILKIEEVSQEGIKNALVIPSELGFVNAQGKRVYFGSGLLVNTRWAGAPDPDGFVYIYGIIEGSKSLIVARVQAADFEQFSKWRFWNGQSWVRDKEEVAPLIDGVSNELSVTPTGYSSYLLSFTVLGLSDKIGVSVGESPIGPFHPIQEVFTCPEYAEKNLFTYNAKAHYHLSQPGKLLISYNTITYNFWEDIQKDASIYHPRFIWLEYEPGVKADK